MALLMGMQQQEVEQVSCMTHCSRSYSPRSRDSIQSEEMGFCFSLDEVPTETKKSMKLVPSNQSGLYASVSYKVQRRRMFLVFGGICLYLAFEGNVFGIQDLPSAAPGLPIRWLSQQLDYSTHATVPTLQHPPPPPSSPHRHHHRDPTLSLIVGHRS